MSTDRERPVIESVANTQIKQANQLRKASVRRKLSRFLIDGHREIELAAASGIAIEKIFYVPEKMVFARSPPGNCLQPVSQAVLAKLSYGQRTDTPVALAVTPELRLGDLPVHSPQGLWLVLDRTEKPGNLGACLRTASAVGVEAVILTDPICDVFNPNAIRASRGAVFDVRMAVCQRGELLAFCEANRIQLLCAHVDASKSLWDCDLTAGVAVVFGNEADGLSAEWQAAEMQSFSIPMQGATDSLNMSISAALTLYEAVRQRGKFDGLRRSV